MTNDIITNAVMGHRSVSLEEIDNLNLMDRAESKYIIPFRKIPFFLNKIDSYYRVLEIDGLRIFRYHNVYFDTPDFLFYNQHITGKLPRSKVRLREYENNGITYLEVKKRTNTNRVKKWRVASGEFRDRLQENEVSFIAEHLKCLPGVLIPVLINRFKRITLASCSDEERVTVDFDLSWSSLKGDVFTFPYLSVVEIKRSGTCKGSFVGSLLKERFIHSSGFSKYCTGNAVVNNPVRQNTLKCRFLMLKKIEYDNSRCIDF